MNGRGGYLTSLSSISYVYIKNSDEMIVIVVMQFFKGFSKLKDQ